MHDKEIMYSRFNSSLNLIYNNNKNIHVKQQTSWHAAQSIPHATSPYQAIRQLTIDTLYPTAR